MTKLIGETTALLSWVLTEPMLGEIEKDWE